MQIYKLPVEDIRFILETFGYEALTELEGYEAYDLETTMAMIEESGRFVVNEFLPLNRTGDIEGVKYNPEDHSVTTPKGFKELYAKFVESGMIGICHPEEFGGGGAPNIIGVMLSEMAMSTNKSFAMASGLSNGLVEALLHHGTDEQKKYYLPKLVSGEWTGTMCLTEPQCGTDLGLMSTKAIPEGDHFLLTGQKIWITFGEHDLTDNILHLVLARLPDSPPGIKGISLFVVPKFLDNGDRNSVQCGGLEHKMGIHASPTCVIDMEDAHGWLVGEPHKGMRGMFTMMNHARLNVGLEGVSLGEIAYQTALEYAKDRRQSRALDKAKQDKDHTADNILVHPDVRRMLLNIKSTNEGMRALAYWVGIHLDHARNNADEKIREDSSDLVALLTPVVKSFLTERGFYNISEAMQVCGGSGFTVEWSIEQYLRDLRIAMIYEGTNHIQALDLVGRKLPMGMGRLFKKFAGIITEHIQEHKDNDAMTEFLEPLKDASKKLTAVTMDLSAKAMQDPEVAGAIASNYLNLFAYTALAYIWSVSAAASLGREGSFYTTKVKTARYYFQNVLPEMNGLLGVIAAGKDHMMSFTPEELESR
jgi:alkylation response protein AidB-like acyl-CoA dehydrogenase